MGGKALILAACLAGAAIAAPALGQQSETPAETALSIESPIGDLLDNAAARAVLAQNLDDFVDNERLTPLRSMPLSLFQRLARPGTFPQTKLDAIAAGLAAAPAARSGQSASASAERGAAARNRQRLSAESRIGDLLDDPGARAALTREMPALANAPAADLDRLRPLSLRALQQLAPQNISRAMLDRVDAAITETQTEAR